MNEKISDIGFYFVSFVSCNIKKTSTGKPFRSGNCFVIEADKSNSYFYKQWDNGSLIAPGIFKVKGGFEFYEGNRQFTLLGEPFPINEKDIPREIFDLFSKKNPIMSQDKIVEEVVSNINRIEDITLRDLVTLCILSSDWAWNSSWKDNILNVVGNEDKLIRNKNILTYRMWGGVAIHHNYLGGLMTHCLEVLNNAKDIYRAMYPENFSQDQEDLIIAGSLLHDIGKVFIYDISSGVCVLNNLGLLHGDHITVGIRAVERIYSYLQPTGLYEELIHILDSHHGEFAKKVTANTFASKIISSSDYLSFAIARGRDYFIDNPSSGILDDKYGKYIKNNKLV